MIFQSWCSEQFAFSEWLNCNGDESIVRRIDLTADSTYLRDKAKFWNVSQRQREGFYLFSREEIPRNSEYGALLSNEYWVSWFIKYSGNFPAFFRSAAVRTLSASSTQLAYADFDILCLSPIQPLWQLNGRRLADAEMWWEPRRKIVSINSDPLEANACYTR